MAKQKNARLAFNRGLVSGLAEARVDIKRVGLAASTMENWWPLTMGPMMLRPGTTYLHNTYGNGYVRLKDFVFSNTDTRVLEFSATGFRVVSGDALVTISSVSTSVTNGSFTSNITGWTDDSGGSGSISWVTGGYMKLLGDGTNEGAAYQTLTVSGGDTGVKHTLGIAIQRGNCYVSIGSSLGASDYLEEAHLYPGVHYLSFTPTGNIYLRFYNREDYPCYVDSVTVQAAGNLFVTRATTLWNGADVLDKMRFEQSGDVVFVFCEGVQPYKVERRDNDSWSLVEYQTDDGPFLTANTKDAHTLTAGALSGATTLTSSLEFFEADHVGALFKLVSTGQSVQATISSDNDFTDPIRVTGAGTERQFSRTITVTAGALGTTVMRLQRSVGEPGTWEDVATLSAGTNTYNDALDDEIIYYRIGIKTGEYDSGGGASPTIDMSLTYSRGSITGICRVDSVTSATVANVSILQHVGSTSAVSDWSEGAWSTHRGFPSAVAIHESRLWAAGKDKIYGSVTDNYSSFDESYVGDAGPISRSIGRGPVDVINWLVSAQNLIVGTQSAVYIARSSSLDEPLTPTNFNLKIGDTIGAGDAPALTLDQKVIYVDCSKSKLIEASAANGDYQSSELTKLVPRLLAETTIATGLGPNLRVAIQRQPDTCIYIVAGGTLYVLVRDAAEEVVCWCKCTTGDENAAFEDVVILPANNYAGNPVYVVVKRVINGSTVRFLEKLFSFVHEDGATGYTVTDASVAYNGVSTDTITGLSHLEGEDVVAFGGGKDLGTYTVASGQVTLSEAVTAATVGLAYTATYISTKLSEHPEILTEKGKVTGVGLILKDAHYQGLEYGTEADYLNPLPLVHDGVVTAADTIHESFDDIRMSVNSVHSTDSRLYLKAASPRPCTVMAAIVEYETG